MNSNKLKICSIYHNLPASLLMELECVISNNQIKECYPNGKGNN